MLVAILSAFVVVAWSAPAHAHTELTGSTPTRDETVGLSTDRLVLTFTDSLLPDANAIVVRDPAGRDVARGEVHVAGNVLDVGLDPSQPGLHTVSYRVVGDDGHAVVGELTFSVVADAAVDQAGGLAAQVGTAGGTDGSGVPGIAPAATARTSGPGALLPWGLAAGALGLLLVLLLLHTASGRRVPQPVDPVPAAPTREPATPRG